MTIRCCECRDGEYQCEEISVLGADPPRCRDCINPVLGMCQCDCFGCIARIPGQDQDVDYCVMHNGSEVTFFGLANSDPADATASIPRGVAMGSPQGAAIGPFSGGAQSPETSGLTSWMPSLVGSSEAARPRPRRPMSACSSGPTASRCRSSMRWSAAGPPDHTACRTHRRMHSMTLSVCSRQLPP